MTLATRLVDRPADVEPDAWRALAGGRFYLSREWLDAFAERDGLRRRVALVEDGGTIVAALPCWSFRDGHPNPRYDLCALAGAGDPEAWSPQLLGGSASGYEGGLLLRDGAEPAAARAVAEALEAARADWGCRSAGLLYLDRPGLDLILPALGPRAVPLLSEASCLLPVRWPDFDGYLASLRSSRRSIVRRDLDAFAASGGRVVLGRLRGHEEELAPLLSAVQRRHGIDESPEEALGFLREWARPELDALAVVFRCEREGSLVGFSLGYDYGGRLTMRVVGLDYALSGPADYYRTLFYEPVAYAAEHGLDAVQLGSGSYRAKLLRGCELEPLWSAVLPPEGVDLPRSEVRRRNERTLERHREELGALAGELSSAWSPPE